MLFLRLSPLSDLASDIVHVCTLYHLTTFCQPAKWRHLVADQGINSPKGLSRGGQAVVYRPFVARDDAGGARSG
jgi:hypothetical protein